MTSSSAMSRLEIVHYNADTLQDDMKSEIFRGLSAVQKYIPSKYFYDARGSALFEKICLLPEYYQTRTELSILKSIASTIMKDVIAENIVELGSGTNWKIKALLEGRNGQDREILYVPVDVCGTVLRKSAEELITLFPDLKVLCIVADFAREIKRIPVNGRKLIVLFGSTIGNFSEEEGRELLKKIASLMTPDDAFLVGMDMIKQKEILNAAYNDSQGITAEFNKNVLNVVNRCLQASFDPVHFDHAAVYNEERKQVEMHLRANRDISEKIDGSGICVTMKEGETILTEISRKFSRSTAEALADLAGLEITRWFPDSKNWFSLAEMKKKN